MIAPSAPIAVEFPLFDATGANANADSLPTGVIVRNGVDTALVVTVTNKSTGLYKAVATLGAYAAGDFIQLRITATVDGVTAAEDVWVDLVETLAADVVEAIANTGTQIQLTGPVLTDGATMTIVQGDDYQATPVDRRLSATLTGSGVGALDDDTWELRLNTRGAVALTVTGDATTVDANTLAIKFPVTAEESAALNATEGAWAVRRTPDGSTVAWDVIRGPLVTLRNLATQRT